MHNSLKTVNDRRIWNLLMVQAWPTITEDKQHIISKSILRGSHAGTELLSETIRRLMGTIVEITMIENGQPSIYRIQLLGPTIENKNNDSLLYYKFLPRLRKIISESDPWGRLQAQVMLSLSSKYNLALYELIQKRVNLKGKMFEDFSVDQLGKAFRSTQGTSAPDTGFSPARH